ncbi:MAG TPA: DUF1570 domain-containing protein [Pirellulales bacterium]|nr:DUF1570 domain-containing protein [Pirellulales bacterium]
MTLLLAVLNGGPPARAENPDAAQDRSALAGSEWAMEQVTLADGRTFQGLVQSESATSIEFMEIRRPPGKPMFLVVRPIERKDIASWKRLDRTAQEELRARLKQHKRRALVEGRRMEDLALAATTDEGQVLWNYHGDFFTLESSANEVMPRRLIVRLGQIFTAYGQLLPPRTSDGARVVVRVFGSTQEYQAALAELGLRINNPAVYLADRNLILAGSEVNRFEAELAEVNRRHGEIRHQFDVLVADAPARVKKLGDDLKKAEVPAADRLRIVLAEQRKWTDKRRAIAHEIAALDRKNSARFNEVTAKMFTRLAHEAFHAYLETYVYPRRAYDVPRWLNEGLAQIFEAGLLEADSLRIDAPNLTALTNLQADLRSANPLELAELLTAGSDTFLGGHAGDAKSLSRAYYYSWGLAYYLAFEGHLLGTAAFDAYLSPAAAALAPVERFEKLVGVPLKEFQSKWRQAMLALQVP